MKTKLRLWLLKKLNGAPDNINEWQASRILARNERRHRLRRQREYEAMVLLARLLIAKGRVVAAIRAPWHVTKRGVMATWTLLVVGIAKVRNR